MFWQELKSVDFLGSVLKDFHISSVFDLSPGSGAMAIACVKNGLPYDGVCANQAHQEWLHGLLDLATLALSAEPEQDDGKTKKSEAAELAAKIKEHFGTAVAEANRMLMGSGKPGDSDDESSAT